jgi:hypothetical protein
LALYRKPPATGLKKFIYASYTYDFIVLTSLTHPRKIVLVVLKIEKAKDLSAPLRITTFGIQ